MSEGDNSAETQEEYMLKNSRFRAILLSDLHEKEVEYGSIIQQIAKIVN